ncbi:hypothetical protein ACKS0A_07323 [Histoplasma ohiense]
MDEVERLRIRPSRFEIVYFELAVWRDPNVFTVQLGNSRTNREWRKLKSILMGGYIYHDGWIGLKSFPGFHPELESRIRFTLPGSWILTDNFCAWVITAVILQSAKYNNRIV